ncbi:MAG: bis(5'-nucleosyl)-tetraphosphatase [Methanobacteriota archaeon]
MVRERSAGAVVFRRAPLGPEYLLLESAAGSWGFPKGHVERGEGDVRAALREVEEETGIPPAAVVVYFGFRDMNRYTFRRTDATVEKEVIMFLMESRMDKVRLSHEHTDFAWLSFEDGRARIPFENARAVLDRAHVYVRRTLLKDRP